MTSNYFKPSGYTDYQKETQWLNTTVQIHDNICFCDNVWSHLVECLLTRGNQFELSNKEKRILQKCLIIKEKDGGDRTLQDEKEDIEEDGDFQLDEGDLQQLFDAETTTG